MSLHLSRGGHEPVGQAVTDSVLVLLSGGMARGRGGCGGGESITLEAGRHRRGRQCAPPPPATFARLARTPPRSRPAMIGGIIANNASGMCCGTAENSYRYALCACGSSSPTVSVVDSGYSASRQAFRLDHAALVLGAIGHGGGDCRRPGALGADPGEVPDQEHHRVWPQCLPRLRGPPRHPGPPDGGFGGDPGVRRRGHPPHGPRSSPPGERPGALPGRGPIGEGGAGAPGRCGGGGGAHDWRPSGRWRRSRACRPRSGGCRRLPARCSWRCGGGGRGCALRPGLRRWWRG